MKTRLSITFFITILFLVACSSKNEVEEFVQELEASKEEKETLSDEKHTDKKLDEEKTPISYLMDKTNDFVKEVDGESIRYTYKGNYKSKGEIWDLWESIDNEETQIIFKEDNNGLFTGYPSSESHINIEYPIEKGKTFGNKDHIGEFTITDTDLTVTTEAGTFEEVIEVTHEIELGWKLYYAPNVGHIKSIDENGKIVREVTKIVPSDVGTKEDVDDKVVEPEVEKRDKSEGSRNNHLSYDKDDYTQYLGKWKSVQPDADAYYQIELGQQGEFIYVVFYIKDEGEEGHTIQTKLTVEELTDELGAFVSYKEDRFGESGELEIQLTEEGLYIVDYNSAPKRAPQRLYDEYYFTEKME